MSLRSFRFILFEALTLTIIVLGILAVSEAEVRSSPSYQLESDSINFAGGLATSTSYALESTVGEIATGDSDSAAYALRAGYQQMQSVFISMTAPASVEMTPDIGGITGGIANGSTSVSVLTDSPSGYGLSIVAESAPAMRKGADTIADYVAAAAPNPDFSFVFSSTQAYFGFSPEGPDVADRFRDDGATCNTASGDTALACWLGLATSSITIATGASNQPNGATTTINFRVGVGGDISIPAGDYYATTTLTALPL